MQNRKKHKTVPLRPGLNTPVNPMGYIGFVVILSKFSDFSLTKSELQEVSLRVGLAIVSTTLIAQAAKEMFEKKLDYVPSS